MNDRVKKTFSISEETEQRINEIAALTHRADSHVIDWLVAEAWARMQEIQRPNTTIEDAVKEAGIES